MKKHLCRAAAFFLAALILPLFAIPALAAEPQDCGAKLIAFTFDDGPGAYTLDLLDALAARNAKATFFIAGYRVSSYPGVLDQIVAGGHQLASHTYNHKNLNTLSYDGVVQEMESNRKLLVQAGGDHMYYIRPPYGNANDTVRSAADAPLINWSVDSLDWKSLNADSVCSTILSEAYDGAIVLVHDIYQSSVKGAIAAMDVLAEQGYEFVTVEELLLRRGITPEIGVMYYDAKNKGINLPADAVTLTGYTEDNLASHWGYDALIFCLNNGYLKYASNGFVLPDRPISRGDFAMALARFSGVDETYAMLTDAPLYDVDTSDTRRPYIAWVFDTELMGGYNGYFRPDEYLTREEISTVLARYITMRGKAQPGGDVSVYSDAAKISGWARAGVALCTKLGIFQGSSGAFLPHKSMTRAQTAVVLQRLLGY